MPRPSRPYHHGDLRKAFLAEAAQIVEEEGVAALTMREIARRLGVSHAASTNHFADKGALLAELAADGFEELAAALETGKAGKTPVTRLRDTGRAYVRFALARPGHYRVMFGTSAMARGGSPRLAEAGARAYALLEQAVVAALPASRARVPERVREAAFLAWSAVHGAATLMLDGPIGPIVSSPKDEAAASALIDHTTATVARAIAG